MLSCCFGFFCLFLSFFPHFHRDKEVSQWTALPTFDWIQLYLCSIWNNKDCPRVLHKTPEYLTTNKQNWQDKLPLNRKKPWAGPHSWILGRGGTELSQTLHFLLPKTWKLRKMNWIANGAARLQTAGVLAWISVDKDWFQAYTCRDVRMKSS